MVDLLRNASGVGGVRKTSIGGERLAAHDLSLYEVKAELDRAIERRRQATEE